MMTTPIRWPLSDAVHEGIVGACHPLAARRNVVPFPFRSGGSRGGAITPAPPSGVTPASPPAPAGGDQGIPHPWSPPPFAEAWTVAGDAP